MTAIAKTVVVAAVAIAAATTALILFPRAMPIVALEQKITRDAALSRADSFFRAHALAPASARTAVRFQGNDSLRTFVELAGGGHDSLNALMRGRELSPYFWSVRAFVPGDPREARVTSAPMGASSAFVARLPSPMYVPPLTPTPGDDSRSMRSRAGSRTAGASGRTSRRRTRRVRRARASIGATRSSAWGCASAAHPFVRK